MAPDETQAPDNIGWHDVAQADSLDALAAPFGIDPGAIRQASGALIIPNNKRLPNRRRACNVFPGPTPGVLAALRDGGLEVSLYDDGREKRELVLKSADVILPTLVFFGKAAVTVGCALLSKLIYDKWIKPCLKEQRRIRAEYLEVDDKRALVRWRRAEGSAEQVCQLFAQDAREHDSSAPEGQNVAPSANQAPTTHSAEHNEAQAALLEASELVKQAETALKRKRRAMAERLFRQALARIREASLWQPQVQSHREHLHRAGLRVHDVFGCRIEPKKGEYSVSCPVMLSHTRGGFSIGGTARAICSLCQVNVLECPHIDGRQYDGVTAVRMGNLCNICGGKRCKHVQGRTYNGVERFRLVTDIELDHVSYVQNPAMPLCAVYQYTLPKADILRLLPVGERAAFQFGKSPIHCHHCTFCDGK